jgi:ankyrin repeat protein
MSSSSSYLIFSPSPLLTFSPSSQGCSKLLFGKRLNLGLLNQYDPDGRTPLSIAVKTNREDVVYSLVAAQASPDIPDEDTGRTPLFYGVANRYRKIVKMMIDAGADVNIADRNDVTPLMMACINKEVKIVKHLIREGARLDVRDQNGWSSLHYAAYGGSYDGKNAALTDCFCDYLTDCFCLFVALSSRLPI